MKQVKIRSLYDPSEDIGIDCSKEPSKTKQADKDSCDINLILRRYENTGVLPDLIRSDARYGDFTAVPSYQEALETVALAQEQFESLSAHVRARFDNEPANMLAFCSDPKNAKEMVKLGLAIERPAPAESPASTDSGAKSSGDQSLGGAKGVPV